MNVLGVAVCPDCDARFAIREGKAHLVGRIVRCSKCHRKFKLSLEKMTNTEKAAVTTAPEATKTQAKSSVRKRRSRVEIREEHIAHVRDAFRDLHARLTCIQENKSTEEDVRIWCLDALRNALGWDESQISTEFRVLGKRVDIALKLDDKVVIVIETKNIRHGMGQNALEQTAAYALNLGAHWAVLTNGQVWRLYRVEQVRGSDPHILEVFDVALLNEDGVSDGDAEMLYLLTQRALSTGDTENMYHLAAATSERRVINALRSEKVVKAVRRELISAYADEAKVDIDDELAACVIRRLLEPDDL